MEQINIVLKTEKESIDPCFYDNLDKLAQQYGLIREKITCPKVSDEERKVRIENFIRKADAIVEEIGPVSSNSADDIRKLRDRYNSIYFW